MDADYTNVTMKKKCFGSKVPQENETLDNMNMKPIFFLGEIQIANKFIQVCQFSWQENLKNLFLRW